MSSLRVISTPRQASLWERILLDADVKQEWNGQYESLLSDEAVRQRLDFLNSRKHDPGLAELFLQENRMHELDGLQRLNIEKLKDPACVCILTGQQPGLLGGPIFWYYKGLTAAAAAEKLETRLGRPVVPVFWIPGDDSDLGECNRLEFLETDEEMSVFSLEQSRPRDLIPMSGRPLGSGVSALVSAAGQFWSGPVCELAGKALQPGWSFSRSFMFLAQQFLGPHGILFVDGHSQGVRARGRGVLEQFILRWKEVETTLSRSARDIRSRQKVPAAEFRPDLVHAFELAGGVRRRIMHAGGGRFLAGSDMFRDAGALISSPNAEGVQLSYDVISRPLSAEAVMPVLGHVLGPGEMGYFFQLREIFMDFSGSRPLLFPRMSATAVSSAMADDFQTAGLVAEQVPSLTPAGLKRILADADGRNAAAVSRPEDRAFLDAFLESRGADHESGTETWLIRRVEQVWSRYLEKRKEENFRKNLRHYKHLFAHLRWLAHGRQERHLNILSLMNLLGGEGMWRFAKTVDPLNTDHQLVIAGPGN